MEKILLQYQMHPTTWLYLSSLLVMGVYFKFHRVLSVRNLDLLLLISFSPGLLLVLGQQERWGFLWLFSVGAVFLVRLLLDPLMVRRPLLDPNLSGGGLTFACIALFVFLVANVATDKVLETDPVRFSEGQEAAGPSGAEAGQTGVTGYGPGYAPFYQFVDYARRPVLPPASSAPQVERTARLKVVTKLLAILGHLAVVIALVLIGYRHFDNALTGVAAATLYLLLPYTSLMTARLDHVIPAALLVWAVEAYRRPAAAGFLVTMAGVVFYPLLLLPLWCSFYWRRGLGRFAAGAAAALVLLLAGLAIGSRDLASLASQAEAMLGWSGLVLDKAGGFWQEFHCQAYRIPVVAAVVVLSGSMAAWPAQKNLGTLLSCSAAVMLASQFCHTHQGGIYMAWYLPLSVLAILRPNLEDRVALSAVAETWYPVAWMPWLAERRRQLLSRLGRRRAEPGRES